VGRSTRQNLLGGLALSWRASPRHFLVIAIVALIGACLPPLEIWLGKRLVDIVAVEHGDPLPMTIVLGLAFGAQRAVDMIRSNMQDLFAQRVERHVMGRFLAKAANLDIGHLDDPATHDAAQRARRDVHWVPSNIAFMSLELVTSSGTVVALIGMLASLHPLLGLLLLGAIVPWITIQRRANRRFFELVSKQTTETRERDYMADLLSGHHTVKEIRSFGIADHLLGRYLRLRAAHDSERAKLVAPGPRSHRVRGHQRRRGDRGLCVRRRSRRDPDAG
jgi:ATP-binding cassette, subfamily B, bacterial